MLSFSDFQTPHRCLPISQQGVTPCSQHYIDIFMILVNVGRMPSCTGKITLSIKALESFSLPPVLCLKPIEYTYPKCQSSAHIVKP